MANVERLRKLRQRILDHIEQFRYQDWCSVFVPDPKDYDKEHKRHVGTTNNIRELKEFLEAYSCNTCGCVAGHACMQAIEENNPITERLIYGATFISDIAERYLELTVGERRFLFMCNSGFHLDFYCDLQSVDLQRATIDDAIERLDILIEHYSK